jgi:molybdenum cofactor guanylyltransferase
MSKTSVAILAGGNSSRMGTDKSFAMLGGKPVFEHVLAQVRDLQLPTILVTNTPEKYAAYNVPMVQDILPDQGALGGLYTAIHTSKSEFTLCVACDMPFLNVALLQHLIELCRPDWDVIVPHIGERPEAMHAIYNKSCLAAIRQQLDQGKLRASGFFDQVKVRYVDEANIRQFDPDLRSFMNVNTPDDLAAAEHYFSESQQE